jgi:hypothetical protein
MFQRIECKFDSDRSESQRRGCLTAFLIFLAVAWRDGHHFFVVVILQMT